MIFIVKTLHICNPICTPDGSGMLIALEIAVIRDTIKISQMAESKEKKLLQKILTLQKQPQLKKSTTAAKKTTTSKKTAAKSTQLRKPLKENYSKKDYSKKDYNYSQENYSGKKAAPVAVETSSVVQEAPVERKLLMLLKIFQMMLFSPARKMPKKLQLKNLIGMYLNLTLILTPRTKEKKLNDIYDVTLTQIEEKRADQRFCYLLSIKKVVININYKSEGIVPKNEFRYNPDLKIGDEVDLYIESMEDKTGQLVVSHKIARTHRAWQSVNEILVSGEIVTGFVKCRTKGGLIVDVFGLESFLPGSQLDVKPIRDYDQYVGKNMEFKVVKINHEFKNVVVSHKALIEAEIEEQKKQIMSGLEKGQVLEGTVKNITSYGVFIDLGGVDGLVHITDLSWGRVNHPEEVVTLDEKIKVVILDDDNKKNCSRIKTIERTSLGKS